MISPTFQTSPTNSCFGMMWMGWVLRSERLSKKCWSRGSKRIAWRWRSHASEEVWIHFYQYFMYFECHHANKCNNRDRGHNYVHLMNVEYHSTTSVFCLGINLAYWASIKISRRLSHAQHIKSECLNMYIFGWWWWLRFRVALLFNHLIRVNGNHLIVMNRIGRRWWRTWWLWVMLGWEATGLPCCQLMQHRLGHHWVCQQLLIVAKGGRIWLCWRRYRRCHSLCQTGQHLGILWQCCWVGVLVCGQVRFQKYLAAPGNRLKLPPLPQRARLMSVDVRLIALLPVER